MMGLATPVTSQIQVYHQQVPAARVDRWEAFIRRRGLVPLSYHPSWPVVLKHGLGHTPWYLEASDGEEICGILPLAAMKSLLFGRFLVGLPYLNYGGVIADSDAVATALVDRAIELAERLDVRHLELRHERAIAHPRLVQRPGSKVVMRLTLPSEPEALWNLFRSNVRGHVRKGQKQGFDVVWGSEDLLPQFYDVFCQNMRDLGTPVFGRALFRAILRQFPDRAELCVVRSGKEPIAGALLLHGWGVTEVPSASSLRRYNPNCANPLMYWHLLQRAVERGQQVFDFGRSTPDGPTYQFKKSWGAQAYPAEWQFFLRTGTASDMRPDNPRYETMIRVWKRLPVWLTRQLGPAIVRGIP